MQTTFIYGLECPLTKQIKYIGKANDVKRRLRQHLHQSKSSNSGKNLWIKDLLSHNLRPSIVTLDEVPMDEWGYWERWWLELCVSWGFDMVNLLQGGNGCSTHAKETIEKIRKSVSGENNSMGFQGKTHTDESKKKISESNKGVSRGKGKVLSEETKKKISQTLKGHENNHKGKNYDEIHGEERSKEIKSLLSKSLSGRKLSEETKKKIGDASRGRKMSEETKQKMRESALERERIKRENRLTNHQYVTIIKT